MIYINLAAVEIEAFNLIVDESNAQSVRLKFNTCLQ